MQGWVGLRWGMVVGVGRIRGGACGGGGRVLNAGGGGGVWSGRSGAECSTLFLKNL